MAEHAAILDAGARCRIAGDLDTTLFVEAGAGSGKTHSMVDRIIALLATGRAEMKGLAAITFTRKAAAELRQRLQVELEKSLCQEEDPERRRRLMEADTHLGEAFVGTIHSFCGRLLREHPFEAGVDPNFIELDDAASKEEKKDAWREYLAGLQVGRPDLLDELADLGATADDLHQVFQRLSEYPEVEPVVAGMSRPDLLQVKEDLVSFLHELREHFPATRPEGGWNKLQEAVLQAERSLVLGETERNLLAALAALDLDPDGVERPFNRWPDRDEAEEAGELFRTFRSNTLKPILNRWREYCHARLIELAAPAVEYAAQRRRWRARLNYEDLLLGAAKLLREYPFVRRRLSRRFTHLMVDEFQDTDPVQAEVMFLLTGTPEDGTDWRRLHPRPGSLFVVGDPKQSVYRFRRADIAIYQEVKELVRQAGGDVVSLTTNFRSLPAVARWVTDAFRAILPEEGTPHQAAFAPVVAHRPEATGSGAGVAKITVPAVHHNTPAEIARLDAERIAAWVAWACAGNLTLARSEGETAAGLPPEAQPGDFLILLRTKKSLAIYAAALEEAGLPVEVSGTASLAASRQVAILLQVLQAVADPEDEVKLLACLRGECLGLSDKELYRFRVAGGRFSILYPEERQPPGPVTEALARLGRYWRWSRKLPPVAAVEWIIEDLGLLPYAAGGPNGNSEAGTLITALEVLRAAEDTDVDSFIHAVAALAGGIEGAEREPPGLVPSTARAVRVMNLHKAKGLEAPVVFLADPSRTKEHRPLVHVDRTGAKARGYFLLTKASNSQWATGPVLGRPPDWDDVAAEESRYEAAEEDRLLYVAATRARNLLVVSRYARDPGAAFWAPLDSVLADVPELEEVDPPAVTRPVLSLDPAEISRELARAESAIEDAAVPGWRQITVTDLTKGRGAPSIPDAAGGKGTSWGQAVHRLLAAVARGLEEERWQPLAARVLEEEGRDPAEAGELVALVTAVWESPFGERVRRARRVLCEVPFGEALPAATLGLDGTAAPDQVLLEGVVDLAFREEDGWVIADYKTDAAAAGHAEELAAHHAPQVRQYAHFWSETLGEPVKEALLVFTSPLQVVPVPLAGRETAILDQDAEAIAGGAVG